MFGDRVERFVRDLDSRRYQSEYLSRLRRRLDVEQAYADLERFYPLPRPVREE